MRAQQSLAGMTTRRLALRSLLLALTLLGTGCAAPDDNAEATLLDSHVAFVRPRVEVPAGPPLAPPGEPSIRSEEHTSELQSLMRISYAVFCLKKKKNITDIPAYNTT